MAQKTGLVIGVTGIVGLNLAKRLIKENWKVYGLSRKKPDYLPKEIQHVAVDLLKEDVCKEKLPSLKGIEYVFYSTWVNKGDEKASCVANKKMVENLLDNITCKLKHFVLVTGTKHYMGPFEIIASGQQEMDTPFRETIPRQPYPNFYYDQEDALFDYAEKRGFTWSVARPHSMIGFAPNNQMNLGTSLAVYASICKHLDIPFRFPGTAKAFRVFTDATDADLLAEHLIWEATNPQCANQAFNVVNGDIFRWRTMWRTFADYFGVRIEEPGDEPLDIGQLMSDKGPVWDEIVKKHGLQPFKLEELTVWWHVQIDVGREISCPTDMSKSREMGFKRFQTTDKAFMRLFDFLRENKYIP